MNFITNKSKPRKIFISADHGLAVFYFLQSDVITTLLKAGAELIILTDDHTTNLISRRFGLPGMEVTGLRVNQIDQYIKKNSPSQQWWADFLRRAGAGGGINLAVVDSYIRQVENEAHSRRKRLFPVMKSIAQVMRRSRPARDTLRAYQRKFNPQIYRGLFEKHQPDLVIAGSPGFRGDRFLLREAAARGVTTAAAIISWDSSSSYGLPGADVDWITCWSEMQKRELIGGGDWEPGSVNIGGMPPYDYYVRKDWVVPREEYFQSHNLDPTRKLITYASSFVSWSPNYQNVLALANLVMADQLIEPAQLLIRLHPIHMGGHYVSEANKIRQLAQDHPHIHVVEPVPLGELGHYSGEDVTERTSMMAHSDVFTTVYSTMVVEASFQKVSIVSVCIDAPEGYPGKFWVPMSQIGIWPTHSRFRTSGAGKVVLNERDLLQALDSYLKNPNADLENQRRFLKQECTFIDGSAGRRTAEFFLSLIEDLQ